ncbi:hypothetical protein G7Z98_11825 [Pseudomonas stutzeri]|nr:hypothetical protein [Stutzerimonas stutzeri]
MLPAVLTQWGSVVLILGFLATLLWLIGLAVVLFLNFDAALKLGLNEWGDFLAGGFAPLALFWLVIGYFQQGKELNNSTKALERQEKALMLQFAELRESVAQQKALVKAAHEEIEITRSSLARQWKREKKSFQPLAESVSHGWIQVDGKTCQQIRVHNVGGAATHVRVRGDGTKFPVWGKLNNPGIRWFDSNYLRIYVEVPNGANLKKDDLFIVRIDYLDGLEEEGNISIILKVEESGFLEPQELDPII